MSVSIAAGMLVALLSISMALPGAAQGVPHNIEAAAARETVVRAGPGITYVQSYVLLPATSVNIVERNTIGTWLRVQALNIEGQPVLDGWVFNGDLELPDGLRYSLVPVTPMADADLTQIEDPELLALYTPPIIGALSERMRTVYADGQALGNRGNVVTKVGDSLSADATYLNPLFDPNYVLGPYDYLEETVRYYAEGATAEAFSIAARRGMTALAALDPMWGAQQCDAGEPPLVCEYRFKQPSISVILFGPNDMIAMDTEDFTTGMRALVEESIRMGVIPVLSTFSSSEDNPRWQESIDFNRAVIDIAAEYEVPLINLWAASRPLPLYGLEGDYIHMRHSGFRNLQLDDNLDARFGATLRNLLTARMLDAIRRTLNIPLDAE